MCCKALAYARTTRKLPTGSLHKNSKHCPRIYAGGQTPVFPLVERQPFRLQRAYPPDPLNAKRSAVRQSPPLHFASKDVPETAL